MILGRPVALSAYLITLSAQRNTCQAQSGLWLYPQIQAHGSSRSRLQPAKTNAGNAPTAPRALGIPMGGPQGVHVLTTRGQVSGPKMTPGQARLAISRLKGSKRVPINPMVRGLVSVTKGESGVIVPKARKGMHDDRIHPAI